METFDIINIVLLFLALLFTTKVMEIKMKKRMTEKLTPRQKFLRVTRNVAVYLMFATIFWIGIRPIGITVWSICLGVLTVVVSICAIVGYLCDKDHKNAAVSTIPIVGVVLIHIIWTAM